ncbi:MAG: hypothetical protein M1825_003125 [Sarcosagium campestre]|nr:MAG: hypothetical protein M1825_003125 [Sarcosagium campestre]
MMAAQQPLPPDAIQRVLYIAPKVHVYQIPPLTSNKGYTASTWTADDNKRQIFTARLRILETAIPPADSAKDETVKTDILLEDPSSGDLFAAAPYVSESVVEQVLDSSRFFAIRVQGEGGRRAVLGLGFEERSEAFDFGVSLQEVRKVQGLDKPKTASGGARGSKVAAAAAKSPEKMDFSLKDGETITINIGSKSRKAHGKSHGGSTASSATSDSPSLFSIPAPPSPASPGSPLFSIPPPPSSPGGSGTAMPLLPPPPTAQGVKAERRRSRGKTPPVSGSAESMGFDDGEFGEFQ